MALIMTERGSLHTYVVGDMPVFSGLDISADLGLPPEPPVEDRLRGLSPQELKVAVNAGDISIQAA